jgi:hypothetical protein
VQYKKKERVKKQLENLNISYRHSHSMMRDRNLGNASMISVESKRTLFRQALKDRDLKLAMGPQYQKEWFYRRVINEDVFSLSLKEFVIWVIYGILIGGFSTSPFLQSSALLILLIYALAHYQKRLQYSDKSSTYISVLKMVEIFMMILLTIGSLIFAFDNAFSFAAKGLYKFITIAMTLFLLILWIMIISGLALRLENFFKTKSVDVQEEEDDNDDVLDSEIINEAGSLDQSNIDNSKTELLDLSAINQDETEIVNNKVEYYSKESQISERRARKSKTSDIARIQENSPKEKQL